MEGGEREVPNYELQVSFTTPQAIHEMGFVQFEENQVLSFLAPSHSHHSSHMSQPLNTSTANTHMGFSTHNDQVGQILCKILIKQRLGQFFYIDTKILLLFLVFVYGLTGQSFVFYSCYGKFQVGTSDPKATVEENCTGSANDGNNSWYSSSPFSYCFLFLSRKHNNIQENILQGISSTESKEIYPHVLGRDCFLFIHSVLSLSLSL